MVEDKNAQSFHIQHIARHEFLTSLVHIISVLIHAHVCLQVADPNGKY